MAQPGRYTSTKALLAHQEKLVDAATRGEVDGDTELVQFRVLDKSKDNDRLLWNLTNFLEPAQSCELFLEDGAVFPPSLYAPRYQLSVTFKNMVRETVN